MDRRRLALMVLGVVAVAVAGWWFLVRSDAPPAPDLASAVETASEAQAAATSASSTAPVSSTTPTTVAGYSTTTSATSTAPPTTAPASTTAVSVAGPAGTWTVDTTIGSFNDFTSAWVGYRVKEVLGNGIGANTAVGRTPLVTGSVELSDDSLLAVEVTVDLRGLRSDKVYRDGRVRGALHTDDHPTATFALVGPVALVDVAGDGTSIEVVVAGTVTINGVAGAIDVAVAATLVGDVVTVVGSFPIVFADYAIEAPSASIVVSVEDHGVVEFQLFLTR